LVASGKSQGVDSKSGEFFKQVRRSGLWPTAEAVHRSTVTKARNKLPWQIFETVLADAVQRAYSLWPEAPEYTWRGMTAVAFDGSKYDLPATFELRAEFDPDSGLDFPGRGHYPQCLVSTAFDVFRRLPLARSISPIHQGSEREDVKDLLPKLPSIPQVRLFDRGYPSYDLIRHLHEHPKQHAFVFRCPAQSTFKAVTQFIQSGKADALIWLDYASQLKGARAANSIPLRVVRLESPDGTLSVLVTNLLKQNLYPAGSRVELYFRRWRIEEQYRDEKTHHEIETFHSRSENGVKQEMFAIVVMCVIARTLMVLMTEQNPERLGVPPIQKRHAGLSFGGGIAHRQKSRPSA
jgi:hypothetical protein